MSKNLVHLAASMMIAVALPSVSCNVTPGQEPKGGAGPSPASHFVYTGSSDASAAVAVDGKTILVADDETNVIRLYAVEGGKPLATHDLAPFVATGSGPTEMDIEGAARVGDRVYWITSHGRNKNGKLRASRYLFFATELRPAAGGVQIQGIGSPFRGLVQAMVAEPVLSGLGLDRATRLDEERLDDGERRRLAPQADGLNIEGLCTAPSGTRMYIGLRNPLARGAAGGTPRAIVIPLDNAAQVVEGQAVPRFGEPLLWDLEGSGVRGMVWSETHHAFFIIGGPSSDGGSFSLYRWSGREEAPVLSRRLEGDGPDWKFEVVVAFAGSPDLLALSDDGALELTVAPSDCLAGELRDDGTCENKHLRDLGRRSFRGRWLNLSASPH